MKACRWLILCSVLGGVALLPGLPSLDAQGRGYCPNAVHLQTTYIQIQRQQQIQMEQLYRQQMEQQRQIMQARQIQQQIQAQQMQTQARQLQTQARTVNVRPTTLVTQAAHLNTQSRTMNTQARTIFTGAHGMNTGARHIDTTARSITTQARTINTTARTINTQARTIDTKARTIDTTARTINTQARTINTTARTIDTKARTIDTTAKKLNTYCRTVTETVAVTTMTVNQNCAQCHKKPSMGDPVITQGPRPGGPTMIGQPRPGGPTMIGQPRPGGPTMVGEPRPGGPTMIGQPRPGGPMMIGQPRPGGPTMIGQPGRLPKFQEPWAKLPSQQMRDPLTQPGPDLREPWMQGRQQPQFPEMWARAQLPVDGIPVDQPYMWTQPKKQSLITRGDKFPITLKMEPPKKVETGDPMGSKPGLVEGIAMANIRPLPAEVLQQPMLPQGREGSRRGLTAEALQEMIAEAPGQVASAETVQALVPLSEGDLQAPSLPTLPESVLVLPPMPEPVAGADDLDAEPAPPAAPELLDFVPRSPDPVARATPGQGAAPRPAPVRVAAETPLDSPTMPPVPDSVLGGG